LGKIDSMEFLYKASPMGELMDADEKNGIVKGYGSYFDNKDSDSDIIRRGAYQKTIKENGERVKYLYQHNMNQPIGKMKELYEDEKGLVFVAEIPKTTLGNDVMELMKAGVITENSVGILPIVKENKGDYREIKEVKLFEISAVTLAANDQAKILDVKGTKNIEELYKRYDNIAKLLRKGEISDDMGYALEAEILKLKALFVNATKPTEEVTSPVEEKADNSEIESYLLQTLKKRFS
jgi:HK97 family phage prohead protease